MNKILLIAPMLYAFCSLTYAGPERYSDKEIKQVAPPAPCPNWTGFYVGAFGGYNLEAPVSILAWAEIGIFVSRTAT
jgi:hypothetical protein